MSADRPVRPDPVELDLVPTEFIAPRLRKVATGAVVLGVVVGVLLAVFTTVVVGVVVGLVVAVPVVASAWIGLRRRIWMDGAELHVRSGVRTRRLHVPSTVSAEVQIRTARIDQITLRLSDGRTRVAVPLALYTSGGGRELPILALRTIADSLWTTDLVPAAAIASVLVDQLRAEARDAGLHERPLYRAVELVRSKGRTPLAILTDREVADLLN